MRIAVSGLAATYPFGGAFWDYLQYVVGFKELGHEVLYIEDTGRWSYSPTQGSFVEDGSANAASLAKHIKRLDPELADAWFFRDAIGNTFGKSWTDVTAFLKDADLFLHISASCILRDEYLAASTVAFIDSDPIPILPNLQALARRTNQIDNLEFRLRDAPIEEPIVDPPSK